LIKKQPFYFLPKNKIINNRIDVIYWYYFSLYQILRVRYASAALIPSTFDNPVPEQTNRPAKLSTQSKRVQRSME